MSRKKKFAGAGVTPILAAAAVIAVIRAGAAAESPEAKEPIVAQTVQGLTAAMELEKHEVKRKETALFTVAVTDEQQAPAAGLKLEVALSMRDINFGENPIALAEAAPGVYCGKISLHTPGIWEAVVIARTGSGTVIFTRKLRAV